MKNIMDGALCEEKRVICLTIIDFFDAQERALRHARSLA
jgi:hypothetical protein